MDDKTHKFVLFFMGFEVITSGALFHPLRNSLIQNNNQFARSKSHSQFICYLQKFHVEFTVFFFVIICQQQCRNLWKNCPQQCRNFWKNGRSFSVELITQLQEHFTHTYSRTAVLNLLSTAIYLTNFTMFRDRLILWGKTFEGRKKKL